jgi:hypothetical protein
MAKEKASTPGGELEGQLLQAIRAAEQAPLPGARDLPLLRGLDRKVGFLQPQENVVLLATNILVQSRRVYIYGDSIVMETSRLDGDGPRLVALRTGVKVEPGAEDWLANLFSCECAGVQFPPPKGFVDLALRSEHLPESLPRIRVYTFRPVFDEDFVLLRPGWHADAGILVHGPDVDPIEFTPGDPAAPALERLPHHLRTLLGGFCFRSDADLVNAMAVMLTGLLIHHFVQDG